ncbi:MAG: lipid asymmetry maintenance protein MlaB [Rhodothermaceae bacterium]
MDVQIIKSEIDTELKFSGELTILNIKEIKAKMDESLNTGTIIRLNHTDVTEVDITYLQLLKSFCAAAEEKNLEVVVADNNSDTLKKVLDTSGIRNFVLSENKEESDE